MPVYLDDVGKRYGEFDEANFTLEVVKKLRV